MTPVVVPNKFKRFKKQIIQLLQMRREILLSKQNFYSKFIYEINKYKKKFFNFAKNKDTNLFCKFAITMMQLF